jgi:penicillin-binding protein 1A
MGPIHADLPVIGFEESGNIVERTYCLESGLIAGEDCTDTAVGWYKINNIPPVCAAHEEDKEDEDKESDIESIDNYWSWLYPEDNED